MSDCHCHDTDGPEAVLKPCEGLKVSLDGRVPSGTKLKGKRERTVVSQTAQVCKGEFVQRVLEYAPQGDKLRWGNEGVHILDAVELSRERVGVVFTQEGQTKFKVLAWEDNAVALGNALVLVEDEEVEEAALLELEEDQALVAYNHDAAGYAGVIRLQGRTATLVKTGIWDEHDPANLCACRLSAGYVALSGVRQVETYAGEVWVTRVNVDSLRPDYASEQNGVRVECNNDVDVYAGGWSMVQVADGTIVLCFPQALDKPVGFAILDRMDLHPYLTVRYVGEGKYAASLPTLQAAPLGEGRWAMAYGVGWLTPDKQVNKSTLALEIWGLTRYAADIVWYGCEDTRYAAGLGGVSAAPLGPGAAITYTGEEVARVVHLGVTEAPYAGPGVPLGPHDGFCRVVPISIRKALQVWQESGCGYVRPLLVEERVIPEETLVHGVAITGGKPGEEITIQVPQKERS